MPRATPQPESTVNSLPFAPQLFHVVRGIGSVSEFAANASPATLRKGTDHYRPVRNIDNHFGMGLQSELLTARLGMTT